MLDHVSFAVNDYQKSLAFYDQTLRILGYTRLVDLDEGGHQGAGYGRDGKPQFWIGFDKAGMHQDEEVGKAKGVHVAFVATSADAIDLWYEKCIALGARDNGAPGPRKDYHPGYYAAFVVDVNGWRLEAVTHHYQPK